MHSCTNMSALACTADGVTQWKSFVNPERQKASQDKLISVIPLNKSLLIMCAVLSYTR